MKKTKQTYSTPEVETLVIRFEGNLLTGSEKTQVSSTRGGYSGCYDLDPDDD